MKKSSESKKKKKLECAIEAIRAHGDTDKCADWYRKWMPDYLKEYGITTMQYSLSCQLMKHADQCVGDEFETLAEAKRIARQRMENESRRKTAVSRVETAKTAVNVIKNSKRRTMLDNSKDVQESTVVASPANDCYVALAKVAYPPFCEEEDAVKTLTQETTVKNLIEWHQEISKKAAGPAGIIRIQKAT